MNNLHITLTQFRNESRLLKEARSIISGKVANKVFVASLHSNDLKKSQVIDQSIFLNRFSLLSRFLPRYKPLQAFKYLEFCLRVALFYRNKSIGLINVHTWSLLPLGVVLKFAYKSKLVYDAHELETEVEGSVGVKRKISKVVERALIGKCDEVFVVGDAIADWYAREYEIARPVVLLNAPAFRRVSKSLKFRQIFKLSSEVKIFLYQGMLSKGRGIEFILETFKNIQNSNYVIVFMGYGEMEKDIREATRNHSNIFFLDAVAPDEVLEYTASADVGLSIIKGTCLSYRYCLPNKLFEYAMSNIPVIVSNMPEMKRMVESYKIGYVLESDEVDCLENIILNFDFENSRKNLSAFSEEYCWEKQEVKMILAYSKLLNVSVKI